MVGELPPLQGNGPGGENLRHRGILQAGHPQLGHIQGRGVMIFIAQAVGVGKVGVGHAQVLGPLVHPPHKGLHLSPADSCQGHRCVVARVEEQPVEQGFQGDRFPRLEIERGPLNPRPFPLDLHGFRQVSPQILRRHQRGHQLRGAGNGPGFLLVMGIEHPAGLRIHQNSGGRGNRRRLRRVGMDHKPRQEPTEHPQGNQLSSHKIPPSKQDRSPLVWSGKGILYECFKDFPPDRPVLPTPVSWLSSPPPGRQSD